MSRLPENHQPLPLSPLGSAVSTPIPNTHQHKNIQHEQHQQPQSQVSIQDSSDLELLSDSEPPPDVVPQPQAQPVCASTSKPVPDIEQDVLQPQTICNETFSVRNPGEPEEKVSLQGETQTQVQVEECTAVAGEAYAQHSTVPDAVARVRRTSTQATSDPSVSSLSELSSSREGRRSERGKEAPNASDMGTAPDTALPTYPASLPQIPATATATGPAAVDSSSSDSSSSSSSSEEEEEQSGAKLIKKYIEVTLDSGRSRPAWIVDYIERHGLHYVRFVDDEGGNQRVLLKKNSYRILNPAEEHKYKSQDATPRNASTRDSSNAGAGARVQPKRARPPPAVPKSASTPMSTLAPGVATVMSTKRPKLYNQDSPPPLTPDAEPAPGHELVGEVITVRWPSNGRHYAALVVGCQDRAEPRHFKPERRFRVHKIFYVIDESTEEIELTRREWRRGLGDTQWDNTGLVGKRVVVMWDVEVDGVELADCHQLPYEAFVVKYMGGTNYTLLYTQQDQLETRDLDQNHESWELSEPGCWYFRKLPIQTWSTAFEIHPVNQIA